MWVLRLLLLIFLITESNYIYLHFGSRKSLKNWPRTGCLETSVGTKYQDKIQISQQVFRSFQEVVWLYWKSLSRIIPSQSRPSQVYIISHCPRLSSDYSEFIWDQPRVSLKPFQVYLKSSQAIPGPTWTILSPTWTFPSLFRPSQVHIISCHIVLDCPMIILSLSHISPESV